MRADSATHPVHPREAVPGPLLVILVHSIELRLVAPKVESSKTTEAAKRTTSIASVHSPQAKFDQRRARASGKTCPWTGTHECKKPFGCRPG